MADTSLEFKKSLNTKGYKLTPQREAILDIIIENKGKHLNSEEIYQLVCKSYSGIGLATVYRTLPLLEKTGYLNKIVLNDGCVRYELSNPDELHSHHHLICLKCGAIQEVQLDMLENLEKQITQSTGFEIKNHSVKFYGNCLHCSSLDS